MPRLMSPIEDDKVNSTPIAELRKNYVKLSHNYLDFVDGNIVVCPKCGRTLDRKMFYQELRNKSGIAWLCKECIRDMATDKGSDGVPIDNIEKAKKTLQLFDWVYLDDIYRKAIENANDDIKQRVRSCGWNSYITQIRSFYQKLTWADSNFGAEGNTLDEENNRRITNVMIKRWGPGFSDSDYLTMEDHYKMLKNNNPNADSNQEIFIEDLCRTRLLMLRAMRGEGKTDDFDKFSKTYRETFKQAGLRTVEEADNSSEETLGVTLATISQYTPEEYYKDKKLYKDFDSLGDYIQRFIYRPIKNLMFNDSERDKEYYVKGSDDGETV